MKKIYLFGNWKMNHGLQETLDYMRDLSGNLKNFPELIDHTEFCLFPPFLSIASAFLGLSCPNVSLGVQNINDHESGAYTGEISVSMAVEAQCRYAIVGHSERRSLFGESPDLIGAKARACCLGGLIPVICVGETLAERDAGRTSMVVDTQLDAALQALSPDARFMIAYEPVWAIGTGRAASTEDAEKLCCHIKKRVGSHIPVLYGGSVNPFNSAELFSQPSIDGGLIGGASLKVKDYLDILRNFRNQDTPA